MSVTWVHIPEQPQLTVPEQWQARTDEGMSVAVLRPHGIDRWMVVMQAPQSGISTMLVANADVATAQIEVEQALYQMGWR